MSRDANALVSFAEYFLGGLAAIFLFLMMLITCSDVIGRYFLGAPLQGAFEMTEILLALLIYAILPLVTLSGNQIAVDLFDRFMPRRIVPIQNIVIAIIQFALLSLIAVALALKANVLIESSLASDVLGIPMGYVCLLMALLAGLSSVAVVLVAIQELRKAHRVARKSGSAV